MISVHVHQNRNRFFYASLIILIILLGLGSRYFSYVLPVWLAQYAGDTLWALMVFFGFCFLFRTISILRAAMGALAFSFLIELSQLYHAPWIDSIRNTKLGGLILGFGFLWSDLVCYTFGIVIGVILEIFITRYRNEH